MNAATVTPGPRPDDEPDVTITLPTTACRRADRAARLAHRRASAGEPVTARVPAPRTSAENVGGPSATVATAPPVADPRLRRIARNAMRDDEWAAQGLVLVVESADLRERAARLVATLEGGDDPDLHQVEAVLRAFRSYDPFLGEQDRTLNRAARRRLVSAVRALAAG